MEDYALIDGRGEALAPFPDDTDMVTAPFGAVSSRFRTGMRQPG